MTQGPEFDQRTRRVVAERVNYRCSREGCYRQTVGPNVDPTKSTLTGEAGHIRGARGEAARYDETMTDEERADISNAIWLCKPCHTKLDRDWQQFPVATLRAWRKKAEALAETQQDRDEPMPERPPLVQTLKPRWCHETTDDDTYIRRPELLRVLDGWFNDDAVRAISVTGIGGSGKTSLIGSWFKRFSANLFRDVKGFFYWSFYGDQDVDRFLKRLLEYFEELAPVSFDLVRDEPLDSFTKALPRLPPIVLVLDGLEVLQHALAEGRSYGAFVDAKLRDFLFMVVHARSAWVCVITSRFPLTDLRGATVRHRALQGLESREAEELLYENGVMGTEAQRTAVATFLECHPLTLRLFAASLPTNLKHSPRQHLRNVFGEEQTYSDFRGKLDRLLAFYGSSLDAVQRAVIRAMSLFRSPVPVPTLQHIASVLLRTEASQHRGVADSIKFELGRLHTSGLILRDHIDEQTLYSCHPIIRDYFRADLFSQNKVVSLEAIDYLTARPDDLGLHGVTTIEPLVLSIEALLELAEVPRAIELYANRLDRGNIFLKRGLALEGKRTFDAFVRCRDDDPKRLSFSHYLSTDRYRELDRLSFLIGAAEFNIELGEFEDAGAVANEALRAPGGTRKPDALRCLARVALGRGDLIEAANLANRAMYNMGRGDLVGTRAYKFAFALYYYARALAMIGKVDDARRVVRWFEEVRSQLDSANVRILRPLANLWMTVYTRGNARCGQLAKECLREISAVSVDHLALAARLAAAHGYILADQPAKAVPLIDHVYQSAVRTSYPHRMCSALILREYAAYRDGRGVSVDRLQEAADIAKGGGMRVLEAEATRCLGIVTEDKAQKRQRIDEADGIADLVGYAALRSAFPLRAASA